MAGILDNDSAQRACRTALDSNSLERNRTFGVNGERKLTSWRQSAVEASDVAWEGPSVWRELGYRRWGESAATAAQGCQTPGREAFVMSCAGRVTFVRDTTSASR